MLKQYFTTTLRYLWRHRLFTSLNILGLTIGISACWIIFRIVDYEFSYERTLPNNDKIYRLVTGFVFDEKENYNGGVSQAVYQVIREQVADIEYAVPVFNQSVKLVEVNTTNSKLLTFEDQTGITATDSTYFSLLPYHWLAGNKSTALLAPESIVLTESRAKQYFPGKKPDEILNQTITYYSYHDTLQRTVTGIVIADFENPTEFTAQEFCSLPSEAYDLSSWNNTNGSDRVYLQIKNGADPDKIIKLIDKLCAQKRKELHPDESNTFKYKQWYEILPLRESHFSTYIDEWSDGTTLRKANKKVLYGLVGIALFIILLACINYINMGVASIPQRTKEIGVRKTLGSRRTQLIGQFLSETLLTTFFAGIMSFMVSKLGFWLLSDTIPPGVTPLSNILQLIGFIILLAIAITILAGLYPAWLITKVQAVNVFRNTSLRQKRSSGFSLQKTLIVFQFVIALVFITSSFIIGRQLRYALTTEMGFNKDAVVLVNVPWKYSGDKKYENKQFTLFAELKNIAGIQNISLGTEPMTNNYSSSKYEYTPDGKQPVERQVFKKWIDTAYLDLYGIKLLAGRNLHASDTASELVINETAVKAFGFKSPHEALGKFIGQTGEKLPVVGVVNDFHLQDFYSPIDPMAFSSDKGNLGTFNIKLGNDASQWQATIKAIEQKWYLFYPPESFSYKFYDETIEQMYEQERQLAKLIDVATFISIFISCLGLFGLAVLTAFQRTKEIGVRKVLGASVPAIVKLLSKEYVVLIALAIIISTPITWLAMSNWLQKFAYRISIEWWMFLFAGVLVLLIALATVSFLSIKAAIANPVKSLRTE